MWLRLKEASPGASALRRAYAIGAAAGLLLFGLGWVAWPVTGPVNRVLNAFSRDLGCRLKIDRARWIPWRHLEMEEVQMETSGGGRLHWEQVRVKIQPASFLSGQLVLRGRLGKGRIDPGSWGLRKPAVQEMLSSGPVVERGDLDLQIGMEKILLRAFRLQGPVLRLQAEGWWEGRHLAHLTLEGSLARRLLEEMDLLEPQDPPGQTWEPFRMLLEGSLLRPKISFASSFYTFSFKSRFQNPVWQREGRWTWPGRGGGIRRATSKERTFGEAGRVGETGPKASATDSLADAEERQRRHDPAIGLRSPNKGFEGGSKSYREGA